MPTDQPYLAGPSAHKTGFFGGFFWWPNRALSLDFRDITCLDPTPNLSLYNTHVIHLSSQVKPF